MKVDEYIFRSSGVGWGGVEGSIMVGQKYIFERHFGRIDRANVRPIDGTAVDSNSPHLFQKLDVNFGPAADEDLELLGREEGEKLGGQNGAKAFHEGFELRCHLLQAVPLDEPDELEAVFKAEGQAVIL